MVGWLETGIDSTAGFHYPDGLTKVAVDWPWAKVGDGPAERAECAQFRAAGDYAGYRSPVPFSEEPMLVCARRTGQVGGETPGDARKTPSQFAR